MIDQKIQDHTKKILKVAAQIDAELSNGESKTVQCPICGNDMLAGKSTFNGHVWAVCKKCGASFMQ
ncbi:hypothetical protein [Eubacterium callanderi]|uniref:hypothetical protein n=1 Tax=Eubacterium callanderi TaxID=53442 RepID=UPI003AF11157